MYVIEVTEDKVSHLADTIGKMLHYGGKAMECIEEMRANAGHMGYRHEEVHDRIDDGVHGRYGMRNETMRPEDYDRMDERYPHDRWDEWPPYMGERRGRSAATGRYVRR